MYYFQYLVIVKSSSATKKENLLFSPYPRMVIKCNNMVLTLCIPNIPGIIMSLFGSLNITFFCESLRDSAPAMKQWPVKQGEKAQFYSNSFTFKRVVGIREGCFAA